MYKIFVDTNAIEKVANSIELQNEEYQRLYNLLFQEVDNVASSWQGADNLAFTNQIKGFNDDFNQISLIMAQYVEFIRNSARAYRECQESLVSQAQTLIN